MGILMGIAIEIPMGMKMEIQSDLGGLVVAGHLILGWLCIHSVFGQPKE